MAYRVKSFLFIHNTHSKHDTERGETDDKYLITLHIIREDGLIDKYGQQ